MSSRFGPKSRTKEPIRGNLFSGRRAQKCSGNRDFQNVLNYATNRCQGRSHDHASLHIEAVGGGYPSIPEA